MLYNDSKIWVQYVIHVKGAEGTLDKDSRDQASKCVQPGQYHTNRGVTFCDFKARAQSLGITPVTYERFLQLTAEEGAKFLYSYYKDVNGDQFPDSLGLAMTESGWLSGINRAWKNLYKTLENLGQTATTKDEAIQKVKMFDEKTIFSEYMKVFKDYITFLGNSPKYSMYKVGWLNRLKRFYDQFNPDVIGQKKNRGITLEDLINNLFK